MNVFVSPENAQPYIDLTRPVRERFLQEPECLFCEVSQNPNDKGHLRVVHGWTKGSDWWTETHIKEPYFQEFFQKARPMWVKDRVIEHFDRVSH